MFDNLNDDNILIYAIKNYTNPNCIMSEFDEDYKRFKYVKRLVKRYRQTGELKERLILNHIITLSNVFTVEAVVRICFYRFDEEDYPVLKTFFLYLNYLPNVVIGIDGKNIRTREILVDMKIAEALRKI